MLLSLPITTLNTCLNIIVYKLRGSVCFRVNLIVLIKLTTGGTVLVIRFTGIRISGKKSLVRSTVRTTRLHFQPVLVASLTFMLKVLPVILTDKPNSTDHRTVNANIFFKVVFTVMFNVILMPFFFILMCGAGAGIRRGVGGS